MGKFVLLNTRIFSGGCDLTSSSNKIELSTERDEKAVTNFGSEGWQELIGGVGSWSASAGGQWEALDTSKVDDATWAALAAQGAFTACPDTASVGVVALLSAAMTSSYQLGGQIGDVAPWTAKWAGSWPLARGVILHPPGTARAATGTGTAVLHTAVPSGKYAYAALHVLSVAADSGTPTLTVKVQSDSSAGFASPTDVITFTAASDEGSQIARLAGPNTDTYWRASWTVGGGATNPSFLFVLSFGIA